MSVEQPEVIDGLGVEPDGSTVTMLISDHLGWGDSGHLSMRGAKIEAYVNAALSGSLIDVYPLAAGKAVLIRLICEHDPDDEGHSFLKSIAAQLRPTGIGFEHRKLMLDY